MCVRLVGACIVCDIWVFVASSLICRRAGNATSRALKTGPGFVIASSLTRVTRQNTLSSAAIALYGTLGWRSDTMTTAWRAKVCQPSARALDADSPLRAQYSAVRSAGMHTVMHEQYTESDAVRQSRQTESMARMWTGS
ncbi:hypothetical protein LPJ54_002404 [Coemansia sp. RSA 1824]|nr:hypothetical protein LPJ54_002404 [Coemansia sp. RSA 1824]